MKEYVMTPKFVVDALADCLRADVVPEIRTGQKGNSHSVWHIRFQIRADRPKACSVYTEFEVKITSSYQKFIEFEFIKGNIDGSLLIRSMSEAVNMARCAAHA
jgi:hypothetical protein